MSVMFSTIQFWKWQEKKYIRSWIKQAMRVLGTFIHRNQQKLVVFSSNHWLSYKCVQCNIGTHIGPTVPSSIQNDYCTFNPFPKGIAAERVSGVGIEPSAQVQALWNMLGTILLGHHSDWNIKDLSLLRNKTVDSETWKSEKDEMWDKWEMKSYLYFAMQLSMWHHGRKFIQKQSSRFRVPPTSTSNHCQ